MKLYHVTGHRPFAFLKVGDVVTLIPGPQCAEGIGVYFSEGSPRPSAADGAIQNGPQATFAIDIEDDGLWWKTKAWRSRKLGKPRTWHTNGRAITLEILHVDDGPLYTCKVVSIAAVTGR